jgi:hypothetical protein
MPFAEPIAAFFADFADVCTLAGVSGRAIFDEASEEVGDDGLVTVSPSATVPATTWPAAAVGQTFVRGSASYRVRRVRKEPPDGAIVRLVLVRV